MPGCSAPRPDHSRVLIAITSPLSADDCSGASPHIPWRDIADALQPLQLQVTVVRPSTAHEQCAAAALLHQSLIDDMSAAGVDVKENFCEAGSCALDQQLFHVANAAAASDVVLLLPWAAYRDGLDVKCPAAGCLRSAVEALFSFTEDCSRCSGAARALALAFSDASCEEVVAGAPVSGFVLNPSAALAADEVLLLPSEAFTSAVRTVFADGM